MSEIERRVAAVKATQAHFADRPHAYGKVDCVRVAAWHLRKMGRKVTGFAKAGSYSSALGARRALHRSGFETVTAAIVANGLAEIPPAGALAGDLFIADGSDALESVGVYAGNGVVLGFTADDMRAGLQALRILDFGAVRAYRA